MTPIEIVNNYREKNGFVKIDMGCGQNCSVGPDGVKFIGIDFANCNGVDIVHDLTKFPYPLEDDSVDEIVSNHFTEHLTGDEWIGYYNECYRILKTGGRLISAHPYCFSVRAFQDPTHKNFIPAERYQYLDEEWRNINRLDHYPLTTNFKVVNIAIWHHEEKGVRWRMKNQEHTLPFAQNHYVNVVADIQANLVKHDRLRANT